LKINFYKYQGTGNDFVMLDGRSKKFVMPSKKQINQLCHRQLGIGADGLIVIIKSKNTDFEMLYYNADGNPGSMCGNGGRCTIAFAKELGLIKNKTQFLAFDGQHQGKVDQKGLVTLKMSDVKGIESKGKDFELNTGSPHYIQFRKDIGSFDVFAEGNKIRYNEVYKRKGINVNFVEIKKNELFVRTYERGVENETLSCGTGVTAAAIAYANLEKKKKNYAINLLTPGGKLKVSFKTKDHNYFTDILLIGPATLVYQGQINI
jgi:diaminopimelate epimerase